jgi:very-short-patch-repair endonuclease
MLWKALRGRRLEGLKFRRQHPLGPYILDFYCPDVGLAVELDGETHDDPVRRARDRARDQWLREQQIRVLRISAMDVLDPHGSEVWLSRIAVAARG